MTTFLGESIGGNDGNHLDYKKKKEKLLFKLKTFDITMSNSQLIIPTKISK